MQYKFLQLHLNAYHYLLFHYHESLILHSIYCIEIETELAHQLSLDKLTKRLNYAKLNAIHFVFQFNIKN